MDTITIDLTGVNSKSKFWTHIKESFNCPEYFGENIDAFHDVLSEISSPTEIVFINIEDFNNAMPRYVEALDKMFTDIVEENENVSVSYEDYLM